MTINPHLGLLACLTLVGVVGCAAPGPDEAEPAAKSAAPLVLSSECGTYSCDDDGTMSGDYFLAPEDPFQREQSEGFDIGSGGVCTDESGSASGSGSTATEAYAALESNAKGFCHGATRFRLGCSMYSMGIELLGDCKQSDSLGYLCVGWVTCRMRTI